MSVRCSEQRSDPVQHGPLDYKGAKVKSQERSMAAKLLQSSGNRDKIDPLRKAVLDSAKADASF
jgi:hypothetical protein